MPIVQRYRVAPLCPSDGPDCPPMAPFAWPDGHRAALSLTFDVDAESAILAVDPDYVAGSRR